MFAVIRTGGKQYRVAADQVIKIDKVVGKPGDLVQFGEVLVVGGDAVTLGAPTVSGAMVAGQVVEQGRDATIIAFKKRRRQNSRRKRGHRQEFTRVRITEILTDGRKPSPPENKAEAARAGQDSPATPAADEAKAAAPTGSAAANGTAEGQASQPKRRPAKAPPSEDQTGGNKS